MVSFLSTVLLATSSLAAAVQGLNVGEYFRPSGADVSGRVGATTPYVRSPCPALNTLANHGYLPRGGKNISHAQLRGALRDAFNIGDSLITLFLSRVPEGVALSDLSKHNFVEHDASLVHDDASSGADPAALDRELWQSVAAHATNGHLGVRELAAVRRDRMARCQAKPTGCEFGVKQRVLVFGEAALLLRALGGANAESASLAFAESFLMDERIPATYTKPASPVSLVGTLVTAGNIQLVALYQSLVALVFP